MVCIDTSFLIALLRRDPNAEAKLESFVEDGERITTTPICACELFAGAYKAKKRDLEIRRVKEFLSRMELLEFSTQACERFGRVRSELESTGTPIGDFDIMIAAIALAHNQAVLTNDVEHFQRIPGLTVETW
ncbi:MAG: type II toxin-antitoxin system VapC family toxin [Candidatus Bathyarchaeia archaeon]